MLSQSEMIRIIELVVKVAEKRHEGDGMYPYASFEYNGRYRELHITIADNKYYSFADDEYASQYPNIYKPLSEGIKLLEELVND